MDLLKELKKFFKLKIIPFAPQNTECAIGFWKAVEEKINI